MVQSICAFSILLKSVEIDLRAFQYTIITLFVFYLISDTLHDQFPWIGGWRFGAMKWNCSLRR
jgi:hypothetical protein